MGRVVRGRGGGAGVCGVEGTCVCGMEVCWCAGGVPSGGMVCGGGGGAPEVSRKKKLYF